MHDFVTGGSHFSASCTRDSSGYSSRSAAVCRSFSGSASHRALRRSERAAVGVFLRDFGTAVDAVAPFFGYEATVAPSPATPRGWPPAGA